MSLVWERLDDVCIVGDYAFAASAASVDPHDRDHFWDLFYWIEVMEDTIDLPEAQHLFSVSLIDNVTDQDQHFAKNLSRDEAIRLAEQHARASCSN